MEKDKVVEILKERNLDAVNESGVVMVYSDTLSFEELQGILKDIGYNASYGLRGTKHKQQA